jgi:hypothetical protein
MTATDTIDAGRLSLALTDLRLPAIKLVWPDLAARADKEGWPAARFLAALAEHEMADVLPHLGMLPSRSPLPHQVAPEAEPLPQSTTPVAAGATPVASSRCSSREPTLGPNTIWRATAPRHCFTRRCIVRSSFSG